MPTPAARFASDEAQVTVRRRTVQLEVAVEPTATTDGGTVAVAVTRADTGEPIRGTVIVADETVQTDAEGVASASIETPGEHEVVARAPDTQRETFEPASATVAVADATIDLALVEAPETVAPGESFSVTVRATNQGPDPVTESLAFRDASGVVDRRAITLAPGNETAISFEGVAPETTGETTIVVAGSDDEIEVSIDVTE